MPRTKVKLQWIESASARKATFRKRSEGLVKKLHEITSLCGGEACVIIYAPGREEPVIWPPSEEGVRNVVDKFLVLPQSYSCNRMVTLQSHLEGRISKLEEIMAKLEADKKIIENNVLMHEIHHDRGTKMNGMCLDELHALASFLKEKQKETRFYNKNVHQMFDLNK